MRSRSRMAALALAVSLTGVPRAGLAQASAPATGPAAPAADAVEGGPVENRVNLILQVSGLSTQGCEIEIKPAHRSCEFTPIRRTINRVPANAVIKLDGISVLARSTGADRDCSFAITIKEPGQPPKTYRRGLRLETAATTGQAPPAQTLKCYLISPTVAAQAAEGAIRR